MKHVLLSFLLLIISAGTAKAEEKAVNIQTVTSPGGITAWFVEDHTAPVISISFAFRGGMALETLDKAGLARMVSILLDEGAGDFDSTTFQKLLNDNSIEMGFSAGRDAFYGDMRTLVKYKDTAFDLLNLALTKPRFDDEAVQRMKNANISQIRRDMGDPDWLVARSFNGTVFEGHSYALPGYGTLASIPAITKDDLRNFIKKQFAKDSLIVSVVGDIAAKDLPPILDRIFGSLPEHSERPEVLDATWQAPGQTVLLPLDIPQTFILAGQPAIPRKHPDFHAAQIVNYILGGGGFGSRLMEDLREKRGLTYGVFTQINTLNHASIWQVSLSTKNSSAGETLDLIRAEWRAMAEKGVTEEELKNAQSYLIGSLALQLTSTRQISRMLTSIQEDDLGIDYLDRRKTLIESVTVEEVNRVARNLLDAGSLTTLLVGDPQNVKSDRILDRAPGI